MAIYKVETDQGIFNVEIEEPSIQTQIPKIIPQVAETKPILPKLAETERRIAERPTAIQRLEEETMQPWEWRKRPIKTTLGAIPRLLTTGMKTIAVPFERAEAAIAGPALRIQKGIPEVEGKIPSLTERELRILPEAEISRRLAVGEKERGKFLGELGREAIMGLKGKKAPEFADIIRTTGVGGRTNEFLAQGTGFFAGLGLANVMTKGKLIESAKKGTAFLKSKTPKIMNKDYALNRSELAAGGLDDLYKGIGNEYEPIYDKIGNLQLIGEDTKTFESIISNLPSNIINTIKKTKLIRKTKAGEIIPDLNNLKVIKGIIRKGVPDKIWSGKAIGDVNTAQLEQTYGQIAGLMAKGQPELQALNTKYKNFKQMQKTLNRIFYDADGNIIANPLINLFKRGGERGKQKVFEQFAEQWPKAKEIMNDIIKYNKRQSLKALGRRALPWTPFIVGGGYMGTRFLGKRSP